MSRRSAGARGRPDEGAAAVEFALLLLPLLAILFGMIQFSWYFYTAQSASSAAREATRRLVVGDCQGPGELQDFAERVAGVHGLTATMSPSPLPPVGTTVTVTVTANGAIMSYIPMPNGGMLTRQVEARVEDLTAGGPC